MTPHTRLPRSPTQARGQQRVEAILDAAAAIIGESGLEGLTVHGTAQRAGTSIGSMYHFFPDLDAVIGALIDRHQRALEALMSALAARDAREWSRMSAAAAADAIVTPIFSYVNRHPDMAALNTSPRSAGRFGKRIEAMRSAGFDIVDRILAVRHPTAPRDVRRARTAVVMGTVEGVATGLNRVKARQARVIEELTRAVTAFLETMD